MQLVRPQGKQLVSLKKLYTQAFPANERKPFWLLRQMERKAIAEILAAIREENFYGLMITLLHRDIVLVDYLAVDETARGKGAGSLILTALAARHPKKRIVLEIEAIDPQAENAEQRVKRKAFYLKNGYIDSGLRVKIYGIVMELMTYGGAVSYEEYLNVLEHSLNRPLRWLLNITPMGSKTTKTAL